MEDYPSFSELTDSDLQKLESAVATGKVDAVVDVPLEDLNQLDLVVLNVTINGIKVGCTHLSINTIAAFCYSDSPTAMVEILRYLKDGFDRVI